jgi:hypothetical protein
MTGDVPPGAARVQIFDRPNRSGFCAMLQHRNTPVSTPSEALAWLGRRGERDDISKSSRNRQRGARLPPHQSFAIIRSHRGQS